MLLIDELTKKGRKDSSLKTEDVIRINAAIMGDKQALKELPEAIRKSIEELNAHLKPRPKERIPEILDALERLWEKSSDQRFGQLLENYVFVDGEHGDKMSVFYQEDNVTFENIKKSLKR